MYGAELQSFRKEFHDDFVINHQNKVSYSVPVGSTRGHSRASIQCESCFLFYVFVNFHIEANSLNPPDLIKVDYLREP